MQAIPHNQLPSALQQITKIKTWYRASEYQNMLFLDAREKYYRDWADFEDQNEWEGNARSVEWLYGTDKCLFHAPDCEYLLAESIDESVFEEAWDRVKEECKEELVIIEAALEVLAKKMERLNIIGYKPNYRVGVVNI
jgi:hypothetical protein